MRYGKKNGRKSYDYSHVVLLTHPSNIFCLQYFMRAIVILYAQYTAYLEIIIHTQLIV